MQRQSPDAPPPPYALQRFLPSTTRRTNLRNVVLVIAFFSASECPFGTKERQYSPRHQLTLVSPAVWALIVGASYIRSRNRDSLPATLQLPYLVLAILYFVCTAIEIFGVAAAYRASVPLVRAYFWAAATSAVIVSACEVVRTVLHFTKKGEIVAACIDSYSTDVARGTYSSSDVSSFCNDSWRNSSYVSFLLPPSRGARHSQQLTHNSNPSRARAHTQVDIALLVFTFFISFFFASVAASFLHQLQHVRPFVPLLPFLTCFRQVVSHSMER